MWMLSLRHDRRQRVIGHKFTEPRLGVGNDVGGEVQQLFIAEDEHLLDRGHAIGRSRESAFSLAADGAIMKCRFSKPKNIQVDSPHGRFVNVVRAIDSAEQLGHGRTVALAGHEGMECHVMFDGFPASD